MPTIRRALLFSVATQHGILIIELVSVVILARLLTPAELGVFAVASSVLLLAIQIRALGVGQYLVREKEVDPEKIRAATGLVMMASWGLGGLIALGAGVLAEFYDEPDLRYVFWIVSASFVLAPFSSIPHAMLIRRMEFGKVLIARYASDIVRAVAAIVLVLFGMSYIGLAWASLLGAAIEFACYAFLRPAGTPLGPGCRGIRAILRFGIVASVAGLLQKVAEGLPDMVLGRLVTMSDVGLFSRGLGLVLFLNRIIILASRPIVLPHLSSVHHTGRSVKQAYLQSLAMQTVVCWPLFAAVNLAAGPMIVLLFGDQWGGSVRVATTLALWGMTQAVHCYAAEAFMAMRQERVMLVNELLIFAGRLTAVILGAAHGIDMVAIALVLSGMFDVLVATLLLRRVLDLGLVEMLAAVRTSGVIAMGCWLAMAASIRFAGLDQYHEFMTLCGVGASLIVAWSAMVWLTGHPISAELIQLLSRIRSLAKAR